MVNQPSGFGLGGNSLGNLGNQQPIGSKVHAWIDSTLAVEVPAGDVHSIHACLVGHKKLTTGQVPIGVSDASYTAQRFLNHADLPPDFESGVEVESLGSGPHATAELESLGSIWRATRCATSDRLGIRA
jgi:hypothetical protein